MIIVIIITIILIIITSLIAKAFGGMYQFMERV